jgi:CTP:molybdopterin cytidylyltransferase MocA
MSRGIAILAAGASRRLGRPKQLVMLRGAPLLGRVVALAEAVGCEAVAVVLGCEAERAAATLSGSTCQQLLNPDWSEGIASSIRVAAAWSQRCDFDALMLLVCDQVRLESAYLLQLWAAWSTRPEWPAASAYSETAGIPAIFPRSQYRALLGLQGDRGAAKLLRGSDVTQLPWPDGAYDLDTPEDLPP